MYLNTTVTENVEQEAVQPPPFGPGFSPKEAAGAVRMEVWSSNFSDAGEDCNEWRLFDRDGKQFNSRRRNGY